MNVFDKFLDINPRLEYFQEFLRMQSFLFWKLSLYTED